MAIGLSVLGGGSIIRGGGLTQIRGFLAPLQCWYCPPRLDLEHGEATVVVGMCCLLRGVETLGLRRSSIRRWFAFAR